MRIIWKGMRGITGFGLLISIISVAVGGVILAYGARMILAASPGNTILSLESAAEGIERACNRPEGSMPEYIDTPVYPLQINCDTCSSMITRATTRTAIAAIVYAGGKAGGKLSKYATKLKGKISSALKKVKDKVKSLFKSKSVEREKNLGKIVGSFDQQVARATEKQLLSTNAININKKVEAEVNKIDDKLDEMAKNKFNRKLAKADDETKDLLEGRKEDIISGYKNTYQKEASAIARKTAEKEVLAANNNQLASLSKSLKEVVTKKRGKAYEVLPKSTAKCSMMAAAGFMQWGAVPTITRTTPLTGRRGGRCFLTTAAALAWVGVGGASYMANAALADRQADTFIEMLEAAGKHYEHIEDVMISNGTLGNLTGVHTGIAIGMDKDLLVGSKMSDFDKFTGLAGESISSRTVMWNNFRETSDDLMQIFEVFDDMEYADYYFSTTSDTRPSNIFIAGDRVALRPEHVEALEANFLEFIRKRAKYESENSLENLEGVAYVSANITDDFEELELYYEELDLTGLVPLDEFVKFVEDHREVIDELSLWETDQGIEQTASKIIFTGAGGQDPVIQKLKKIQERISILSAEQQKLNSIRDRAWGYLQGTECTKYKIAEYEVCISDHAILMNCYWDDVREYSWIRGEDANLGDCESMEVIVNRIEIEDELGNKIIWDSIPAARQTPDDVSEMTKVVTRSQAIGTAKAGARLAFGMGGASFGKAAGSLMDLIYCEGKTGKNTIVCCVQDAGCYVGMCRVCQKVDCSRSVVIQPELLPSVLVIPNATITLRGNVGYLS